MRGFSSHLIGDREEKKKVKNVDISIHVIIREVSPGAGTAAGPLWWRKLLTRGFRPALPCPALPLAKDGSVTHGSCRPAEDHYGWLPLIFWLAPVVSLAKSGHNVICHRSGCH